MVKSLHSLLSLRKSATENEIDKAFNKKMIHYREELNKIDNEYRAKLEQKREKVIILTKAYSEFKKTQNESNVFCIPNLLPIHLQWFVRNLRAV